MASSTRATRFLERSGVEFSVHRYELAEPPDGVTYGEAVARRLGVEPARVFKTLVAAVDGSPVVAIVPVEGRLSLKALARAAGGKKAEMAPPAEAERLTGYVVGGISPFGQRRRLPVVADETLPRFDTVYVSGGGRGIQVELRPGDLLALLGARTARLTSSHGA